MKHRRKLLLIFLLSLAPLTLLSAQSLSQAKSSAVAELEAYPETKGGQANYTTANWRSITRLVTAYTTQINNASTAAEVTKQLDAGKAAIDSIRTRASATTIRHPASATFGPTTVSGGRQYIFEFEYLDFTGHAAEGYSGSYSGIGMIQRDTGNFGASNGFSVVSSAPNVWTFYLTSSAAAKASLSLSLSGELAEAVTSYGPGSLAVRVNGTDQNVSINVANGPVLSAGTGSMAPFSDYQVSANAALVSGANIIEVEIIQNSKWVKNAGQTATASPLLDALKVVVPSSVTLAWDSSVAAGSASARYPKEANLQTY
jgi:hypothetical protein